MLGAAVVLAAAPPATAQSPLDEYQRTGQISPCGYSVERLSAPLDSDLHQYAREFETAVAEASREGCVAGGVALTAGMPRATAAGDRGTTWPAPLVGLALAMAAILIGAVVAAAARSGGWGSGGRGPVGHAFGQLGLILGSGRRREPLG